jgi:hypothetical protein
MGNSWKEINWEVERPSPEDVSLSRKQLEFMQTDVTAPAALGLIETFRSLFHNGGAHIASFHVDQVDDTAHWFFSRNRFDEYGFITGLLASEAVASALPELAPIAADLAGATFEESSPLIFDGDLARTLIWAGPYTNFDGSMADAKRMGVEVSSELIGDRFEDFRLDYSHEPWSTWFKAIAWDGTWILTDQRDERVTLICITDTD